MNVMLNAEDPAPNKFMVESDQDIYDQNRFKKSLEMSSNN